MGKYNTRMDALLATRVVGGSISQSTRDFDPIVRIIFFQTFQPGFEPGLGSPDRKQALEH